MQRSRNKILFTIDFNYVKHTRTKNITFSNVNGDFSRWRFTGHLIFFFAF